MLYVWLLVAGTFPCVWTTSTTPVPILRYVDTQNTDGSYTFGLEGADGTYKLETRYADGRVKGKYGYFDPEGVFREATYGAQAGRGFEPKIEGVNLPPPTIIQQNENEILQSTETDETSSQKFKHFQAKDSELKKEHATTPGRSKIFTGGRTVLKKRLRAKARLAPAEVILPGVERENNLRAREEQLQRENNLRAREEQLQSLRDHRQQLLYLQGAKEGARQSSSRHIIGVALGQGHEQQHPFVSGLDINSGAYSYSY